MKKIIKWTIGIIVLLSVLGSCFGSTTPKDYTDEELLSYVKENKENVLGAMKSEEYVKYLVEELEKRDSEEYKKDNQINEIVWEVLPKEEIKDENGKVIEQEVEERVIKVRVDKSFDAKEIYFFVKVRDTGISLDKENSFVKNVYTLESRTIEDIKNINSAQVMVLYDITILYGDSYVTLGTVIRDIYREAGILVEDLETDLEWFAKSPKLKEYAVTISDNFGQVTLDFTIKDKEIDPKKFYIRYGSTGKREDLAKWIRKSVTKQYYREGMEILRELEQEGY